MHPGRNQQPNSHADTAASGSAGFYQGMCQGIYGNLDQQGINKGAKPVGGSFSVPGPGPNSSTIRSSLSENKANTKDV